MLSPTLYSSFGAEGSIAKCEKGREQEVMLPAHANNSSFIDIKILLPCNSYIVDSIKTILVPVSYTHLDVYKRQGVTSNHTVISKKTENIRFII